MRSNLQGDDCYEPLLLPKKCRSSGVQCTDGGQTVCNVTFDFSYGYWDCIQDECLQASTTDTWTVWCGGDDVVMCPIPDESRYANDDTVDDYDEYICRMVYGGDDCDGE